MMCRYQSRLRTEHIGCKWFRDVESGIAVKDDVTGTWILQSYGWFDSTGKSLSSRS
jgi:hypothetical protein